MPRISIPLAIFSLVLSSQLVHSNPIDDDVQSYCNSMGDGLYEDEARMAIEQCIEEYSKSSYEDFEQMEEEPEELDCYEEANRVLDDNPDSDYDKALQDCLDQRS